MGRFTWSNGKIGLANLMTWLAADVERNRIIARQIVRAADAGRKVLVLTDRLDQIELLISRVREVSAKEPTMGRYVGGMKKSERAESAQCQVIFGTYALAKEGLDIPELDVLVMATPKQEIAQPIGRILRSLPGKKQPLVIDPVDDAGMLVGFARARAQKYFRLKYEVKQC
jgi:superfamily II DNA or RNA helicase